MAELEVARHGKKALQALGRRDHPIAHRLREMALEVVTIVFAVTLSIWLHGLSEHHHEQQQVKVFLSGLKYDLADDIARVKGVIEHHHRYDANFAYLAALDARGAPEAPRFDDAYELANTNASFEPRMTRFEGFQSSGRLTNIENEALLNRILSLYQVTYPNIMRSRAYWGSQQEKLRAYLDNKLESGETARERYEALVAPRAKRLLRNMNTAPQLYQRMEAYAVDAAAIVKAIDAAYPELAHK